MKFFKYRQVKWAFIACLIFLCGYGSSRLYYHVTDGFTIGNIVSELPYQEKWAISPLGNQQKKEVGEIVSQPFHYLGKGCQSYVFQSEDGSYILKFVKYQRFTPQAWLAYLDWVPGIHPLRLKKIEKKRMKLDMLFTSWKIAYENLQEETGLIYVHLNKPADFNKKLTIYDKMGFKHEVDLDSMEYLIQRKATMLCPEIETLMKQNREKEAKILIGNLVDLILSEYSRGLADNDHALMQNTGVIDGKPVHIDAGQFVLNENVKNPDVYKQELFSKTFKFNKWLKKRYPSLSEYLEEKLIIIIGPKYYSLKPQVKNHAWSE